MKKTITLNSTMSTMNLGKKSFILYLFVIGFLISPSLVAQSYTYTAESFEDAVWNSAPSTTNAIASSTGTWSIAKSNIQSSTVPAQDGTYSLYVATKTNALITPSLESGVGVLTYNVSKTSSRNIMVYTSIDNVNWSAAIETFAVLSTWSQRSVAINDQSVRYIKFEINSNGGVYIDNVLITRYSGTTNLAQSGDLKINCYPSLVENDLNIDFPESGKGNADINIYSVNGQKVFSSSKTINFQETVKLNLKELNSGLYFVNIKKDNNSSTIRKFIKN